MSQPTAHNVPGLQEENHMPFVPQDVFEDRAKQIRTHLGEHDLKALIVTTPDNFYMVSGFHLDVAPWERPVAAVIPAEGEPFLVMNELSTNHLTFAEERDSLFITDYVIYTEHPRSMNRTWTRGQWGELLAMKLAERGITKGRVGVEGHGPSALTLAAPKIEFEDVTRYLVELREVKYPAELDILRECASLTDYGQDRYMELLTLGMNVKAFDFEISKRIMEEGARRFPEDRLEVRLISSCGPYSAAPHGS